MGLASSTILETKWNLPDSVSEDICLYTSFTNDNSFAPSTKRDLTNIKQTPHDRQVLIVHDAVMNILE